MVGVVMEVWGGKVGRLVVADYVSKPSVIVYFDENTLVNGRSISHDYEQVFAESFWPGLEVLFQLFNQAHLQLLSILEWLLQLSGKELYSKIAG